VQDKECLQYILHDEAGSCKTKFGNGFMDCGPDGNILECRRRNGGVDGMLFEDFLKHP
jgi:hypothetical protein